MNEETHRSLVSVVGAGTQIRTADLLITNQLLCLTELFRQPDKTNFSISVFAAACRCNPRSGIIRLKKNARHISHNRILFAA